ncbi:hypothetical protein IFM5058_11130 [Aspergillus udagawae]|nr:hypothetical protein IFM5058_11130 [Aspergillus udagawae]
MKGARIPRYRRDMYGAAAGLPPTLARSGDCTPTVMNDHPICIYTDTRTSVSIWIGAPPPYPKGGQRAPRARPDIHRPDIHQLAARARGESPLGRRPLARTGVARARQTARVTKSPCGPSNGRT